MDKMTKNEKIELLIEAKLTEWVYAANTDSLVEALHLGWKGYDEYSDEELEEELSSIDDVEDMTEGVKKRFARTHDE